MNDNDPAGRAGRRNALAALITRILEKELPHEDQKSALALLLGEAQHQLANVDRIAAALERIAAAIEATGED
jgi:hypothetical protein